MEWNGYTIEREANLCGADLTGANLTGRDLTLANLTGADLTGADLTRADLSGADLTGADLTKANLTKAHLTKADLTSSNLTGANLAKANLTGATLTSANLTRANLTSAVYDDSTSWPGAVVPSTAMISEQGKSWQSTAIEAIAVLAVIAGAGMALWGTVGTEDNPASIVALGVGLILQALVLFAFASMLVSVRSTAVTSARTVELLEQAVGYQQGHEPAAPPSDPGSSGR